MNSFTVDAARCRKDGICAAVCPVAIIRGGRGELPVLDEGKIGRCLHCGQCAAFCPANACAVPGFSLADNRPLDPKRYPSPEQAEELLFARRSIRNFRQEPVPRGTLERILNACRWAPTGRNRQGHRWVMLESEKAVAAFLAIFFAWLKKLPEADPEEAEDARAGAVVRAYEERGLNVVTRNAPHIVITVGPKDRLHTVDGTIALAYFEVLAQAFGVGCMWNGHFQRMFCHPSGTAAREYLGLQPHETAYHALVVGLPRFAAVSRPPRNPLRARWE